MNARILHDKRPSLKLTYLTAYLVASVLLVLQMSRPEWLNGVNQMLIVASSPGLSIGRVVDGTVRGVSYHFQDKETLVAENARLKQEVARLQLAAGSVDDVFKENNRLRCLLELHRDEPGYIAAEVLNRAHESWNKTLLLDRGANHGVVKDSAVITSTGVVGQVVEVLDSYCRVQLVLDEFSGVPCKVLGTDDHAILRGTGSELCSLEFLHYQRDNAIGALLVTTGLGGVYPKGIQVGRITRQAKDNSRGIMNVMVRPTVDMDSLHEVMIVTVPQDHENESGEKLQQAQVDAPAKIVTAGYRASAN